jgi:DNA-binding transcriptional ArsR family regulator
MKLQIPDQEVRVVFSTGEYVTVTARFSEDKPRRIPSQKNVETFFMVNDLFVDLLRDPYDVYIAILIMRHVQYEHDTVVDTKSGKLLSIRAFTERTGLSRQRVAGSLRRLEEKGIITLFRDGNVKGIRVSRRYLRRGRRLTDDQLLECAEDKDRLA